MNSDLEDAARLMRRARADLAALRGMGDATAFAVQLRYDDMEIANTLSRDKLVDCVAALLDQVERKIDQA